jgi:hypothetical protein
MRKMQHAESQELLRATEAAILETDSEHQFTAADICHLHRE